jgi:BCD family chlorophyll transporter-like MFS transporter
LNDTTVPRFSFLRSLKIGSFNIGSAMVDILTASVWNRILIADLGASATPVSILLALRYLLAPVSVWIGARSDARLVFGLRRIPYIWLGRLMMLAGIVLLPITTLRLSSDIDDPIGWLLALAIFVFYGLGTAVSGGPYLALIHDSAPPAKRGVAISIAQTLLIVGFAASPILYARLLPSYTPERFQALALLTGAVAGGLWFLSVLGEERRTAPTGDSAGPAKTKINLRATLRSMWSDQRTRLFFAFLALGAMSSFAQDAVLEPFGGDVFGLSAGATTRFAAYFGGGVLATMIITSIVTRRRRPEEQTRPATLGLSVMIAGLALLAVAGLSLTAWLITPALIVFGLGFGVYTVGGVSLLMAMTAEASAGAYLGLWTMTQLVSRGVGIGLGGIVRDVGLALTGSLAVAYSSVFILEAIGLAVCIALLSQLDVVGFARDHQGETTPSPMVALAD